MSGTFDAMRAHSHGEPDVLVLDRVAVAPPGPGEVAVDVAAAGVNYPDLLVVSGRYQVLPPLPFIPGKEVAGTVVAVGPGVEGLARGDRVMSQLEHGGYAARVVAPAPATWHIPDAMPFGTAAAMGLVFQTAYFALVVRGGFVAGQTVLVTGAAGGVGSAAVQLVQALGGTAIAGIRGPGHAAILRAHGAAHVIDLGVPGLRDAVRDQVRAVTGGRGVDLVIDQVGGDVFDGALRSLAWCGRLVVVGFAGGQIPAVKANYLLVKNIAVSGLQWSDYRDRDPALVGTVQKEIMALYQARKIVPMIDQIYRLHEAAVALARLRQGGLAGKLVLGVG